MAVTLHRRLALCVLALAVAELAAGVQVTISNVVPRRDTAGNILDAHDGKVVYQNGTYYWYAASYGMCKEPGGDTGCAGAAFGACGFRADHNVSLFTSTDLATWTNHGPVFQTALSGIPQAVLFCPKALYNRATRTYVLWFNWISGSDFANSFYAVATAKTPFGPFVLATQKVTTLAHQDTGDFNLLQDDDGSAYIIYTADISAPSQSHRMSIERLTPDYLATMGASAASGFFGNSFVEAPAMFKRQGIYYAVFGSCCCYCKEGSNPIVYTAASPLGPYTMRNALEASADACAPRASRASVLAARACSGSISSQQTDIFGYYAEQGEGFMWMGDQWQSAPDGIKAHDNTYWQPLAFDAGGNVTQITFTPQFTLDMP